jgi:mannosyltransferase
MPPPRTAAAQARGDSAVSPSASPVRTWISVLIFALLAAGAGILRFLFIARKPFWFDECFSVEVARLSWHDFLRLLWWREANMSLYYVLLRGWLHWGFHPLFVRSFSVLCSLATLPAIYWLACQLFNRRVGMTAVALMSCNAYSIRYAQEARSYALFLLLATLSSGFLVAWLREPSLGNRRGYVVASVLAVYAHFYALLLIAVQWLAVRPFGGAPASETRVMNHRGIRRAWFEIGVAVLPLLAFVTKTGAGPIRWIARPGFHDMLDYWERLAGNGGWPLLLLYAAACFAAVMPLSRRLLHPRVEWETWRLRFLLLWLILPVALAVVLSLARPVFLGRYFIFCLPPLVVLGAAGLANLRRAWMVAVCLAVMLLLSLKGTVSYYNHDFDLERDGSEAAANYIYDHAQPGDAILFHIAEARIPYEFFGSLRTGGLKSGVPSGPEIVFPRHGDHLDYRDVTGKPSSELARTLSGQHGRVWMVLMRHDVAGHADATTQMLNQTFGQSFPEMSPVQFPQVEVRLYSKR